MRRERRFPGGGALTLAPFRRGPGQGPAFAQHQQNDEQNLGPDEIEFTRIFV